MAQDRPAGIVNHPWLVVLGIAGACIGTAMIFRDRIYSPFSSHCSKVSEDIGVIREALDAYAMDHEGAYPQNLHVLIEADERGHRYLNQTRLPRDPWNREYLYVREPLNVMTLGADGKPGGTGDDADIDYISLVNGR